MTTRAATKPPDPVAPGSVNDHETASIHAPAAEPTADALRRLDHRTRRRALPRRLAPRGQYLAMQDGEETRLVPLEARITHIGRGIAADLRFEDPRISRNHAIIACHGRYSRLLDNRSSHGTFLNGRRIVAMNLRDGDVIRLGPVAMQYLVVR